MAGIGVKSDVSTAATPAVAASTPGARARRSFAGRGTVLTVTLVGVFVLGTVLSPAFLELSNLQNIMLNVSILGTLALGQTLVMLLREVDLSIGALIAFAPVAAIQLAELILEAGGTTMIQGTNYVVTGTFLIVVLTVAVSVAAGLLNGVLTVKGLVPSLIVTLGMLYALRGAAYVLSGGHPLYLTDLTEFMELGTTEVAGVFPVSFVIFVAIGALVALVLKFTKVGPAIYATGGNEKGAIYSGVKTGRWKVAAFVFCGFCAGVAALFYSARLGSVEPAQAFGYELSAIAIAVIGGTTLEGGRGTAVGTMLGAVVLAVVINIATLEGVVVWYQTVITGAIIIAAAFAYLRPSRASTGA